MYVHACRSGFQISCKVRERQAKENAGSSLISSYFLSALFGTRGASWQRNQARINTITPPGKSNTE